MKLRSNTLHCDECHDFFFRFYLRDSWTCVLSWDLKIHVWRYTIDSCTYPLLLFTLRTFVSLSNGQVIRCEFGIR